MGKMAPVFFKSKHFLGGRRIYIGQSRYAVAGLKLLKQMGEVKRQWL